MFLLKWSDSTYMKLGKKGLSLVEALVGLAILGGTTVILGQILSQALLGQKRLGGAVDFDMRMFEVLNIFSKAGGQCGLTSNKVFKFKSGSTLSNAKFGAASDEINWLGYQINGQNVKVIEEGEALGARTIQSIQLVAKKDISGALIAPITNSPSIGQTTREVELIIQAAMANGSSPIQKTLSLQIITQDSNSDIVGCSGTLVAPGSSPPVELPDNKLFPLDFTCNNVESSKYSMGFRFHYVDYNSGGTIKSVRYRDLSGSRFIDFRGDGSYLSASSSSDAGTCRNKSISQLNQVVEPP